jgi:hypothetical protein
MYKDSDKGRNRYHLLRKTVAVPNDDGCHYDQFNIEQDALGPWTGRSNNGMLHLIRAASRCQDFFGEIF